MPLPTFRSATTTSGTGTSVTVTKPTATATGDGLLVTLLSNTSAVTFTAPAGWALVRANSGSGGGGQLSGSSFFRAVLDGAGEPASYAFTLSTAAPYSAVAGAYVGVTAVHVSAAAVDGDLGTPANSPSVTTTVPDTVLLRVFGNSGSSSMTTPAGTTARADTGSSARLLLVDEPRAAAGATGTRTSTLSSPAARYLSAVALTGNRNPNAPAGLTPASGSIDRTATQRFSWSFSDPDPGDSQSAYDLQYRVTGTGPWTLLSGTTSSTFRDIAGGTFTAASYEWQVRTYDAQGLVSPWSSSAFFTAATPPAGPTITTPTNGSTVSANATTLTWSYPNQQAYQVRKVADVAGAPDTATVYFDTGIVNNTTVRSLSLSFPTNNRTEHLQVRVLDAGLWSPYSSVRVVVSYTPPALPTLVAVPSNTDGSVAVTVTNPTPSGGQPAVVGVDIIRRRAGQSASTRLAKDVAPSVTYLDRTPASGVAYEYRADARAANGTVTVSAWTA